MIACSTMAIDRHLTIVFVIAAPRSRFVSVLTRYPLIVAARHTFVKAGGGEGVRVVTRLPPDVREASTGPSHAVLRDRYSTLKKYAAPFSGRSIA